MADSANPLVSQTEYRLYRPAQNVTIFGLVHGNLSSAFANGIAAVTIRLLDEKGNSVGEPITATLETGTGEFSSAEIQLPPNLLPGLYMLEATISIDFDKAKAVIQDASQLQELQSLDGLKSTQALVVSNRDTYLVYENGEQFKVYITSNAKLCCNRYSEEQRRVAFESVIANSSSVNTTTEVAIPKVLLGGQVELVVIDGQVASNDTVIIKNMNADANNSMTAIEINYGAGAHTIEVYGTSIVPEFPLMSCMLLGVGITIIVSGTLLRLTKLHGYDF